MASATRMVGREDELAVLQQHLERACTGQRQMLCLTGEPGIGKSTMVDAFLHRMVLPRGVWHALGQCVEQYGPGEVYRPVFEALGRLCRGTAGAAVVAGLRQYAPTWLAQMPGLLPEADYDALRRRWLGVSRAHMLQELVEALDSLSAAQPLVLVFEDLHWSDYATLDFLAVLARRREPARLLVLGTYRPAEAFQTDHPVHRVCQELQRHGLSQELRLDALSEVDVEAYVASRCADLPVSADVPRLLYQRTGGNPLFLITLLDDAVGQGQWQAQASGVPESLRQLIEQQLARLPAAAQRLLEAASVVGTAFSVAAVAAGVEQDLEAVDTQCATWARHGQFVRAGGLETFPDGMVAARYRFVHDLYRETCYARLPISRRVRLHRQIGAYLETAYGVRAPEIAAELAGHFVQGHATAQAVRALGAAGEQALQRSAPDEARQHFTQALELLTTLPDTPERAQQELALQLPLGSALMAVRGAGAVEVESLYERARRLSAQVGTTSDEFAALWGLWRFSHARAQHHQAQDIGAALLLLAQRHPDPTLRLAAHQACGTTCYFLGEFVAARTHLEQGLAAYTAQRPTAMAYHVSIAPEVYCRAFMGQTLWMLGYPDQALHYSREACTLAQALAHSQTIAFAQYYAARTHMLRRDAQATLIHAEAVISLTTAQQFAYYLALGTFLRGWALAATGQPQDGLVQMQQGLQGTLATGAALVQPLFLPLLAEVCGSLGQVAEAQRLLTEAQELMAVSGQHFGAAEATRLQGMVYLQQARPDAAQAERCFQHALDLARQQQAKARALRASISLARLWQQQGKVAEARHLLSAMYHDCTEGFDTGDMQEAAALVTALGGHVAMPPAQRGRHALPSSPLVLEPLAEGPADRLLIPDVATPPGAPQGVFRLEGEYWTLAFEGSTCRVKDVRGMHHLAHLLRQPHHACSALDLDRGAHTPPVPGGAPEGTSRTHTIESAFTDAGAVLDATATAAYRQRLAELQRELAEAEAFHDPGRVARVQAEIDFLTQELTQALGLGGRARKAASPAERARVNVTRAIKAAITRIRASHPALGAYLARTVRTGYRCQYAPETTPPVSWQV